MGNSSASNSTSTTTDTITTTNNNNVIQTVNRGADAVALARALSSGFAQNLSILANEQIALSQQAASGLQTLTAGTIARGNGGELVTPGASSVSPQAQFAGTLTVPIILAAAVIAAAVLLTRR